MTCDKPGIAKRGFGLIAGTLVFLLLVAGCHRRPRIVVANGGYSAWDDNKTVSAQLQLQNVSKRDASQLRVTGVKVKGGRYQGPYRFRSQPATFLPAKTPCLTPYFRSLAQMVPPAY